MAEDDRAPGEEDKTLARHRELAEVVQGKRALAWSDLETLIYDSRCLTPPGKRVALWSLATMQALLKEKFLASAQQAPEILTAYPFFALDFFPGANDVPRVYAEVFRFALQLHLLQALDRFGRILRSLRTSLEAVLWYHTQMQFEVASLAQQDGWQIQLELPYNTGTRNKSDVRLSKGATDMLIDAVALRMSESGRKKQTYDRWLATMSMLHGIDITGRLGEPWRGTREEEQHWVQNVQRTIVSVRQSGLVAVVQSPNGGSLTFSRAASGKRGMARIVGTEINEDLWNRLGRALGEKNEQASGNLVWLRMGEYAGLWHWSSYREMTLEEKVQNLSPLVQAALASLPHIAGIILSPGIEPDLAPGGQLPSTFPRGDGAIAVHCALPGSCSRESIIIPRSGMSADAYTFAALYEHEVTWLDWALRQAGHPPFHDLVQDL